MNSGTAPSAFTRDDFDRCWPFLAPAAELQGTYGRNDVWALIAAGRVKFWPMEASAAITNVITYPTGLRRANAWLAGGDLLELREWQDPMIDWARSRDCHLISQGPEYRVY
jgi:hypothetical protein